MLDAAALPIGSVVAGRYRVLEEIGRGGMGVVYKVEHVATDETLAMKVLISSTRDAEALARFAREARAPARIDSEYVVRVTDADTAPDLDGAPFIVMEYLRGTDLRRLLEQRGRLPPAEVALHLGQAAHALDKAHAIGIVHRDLKPDNLFLALREGGAPCIKLLDFGIAKLAQEASTSTQTGAVLGTPAFMSPEQARGDGAAISPATDVWALGLIAHQLLTGSSYWGGVTAVQLIAKLLFDPIAPPSARGAMLGPAFDAWFATCCAREPERRFRTAGQAVAELAAALGVVSTSTSGPPPMWTSPPPVFAPTAAGVPAITYGTVGPPFTYPSPPNTAAPETSTLSRNVKFAIGGVVFLFLATFCALAGVAFSRLANEKPMPQAVSPPVAPTTRPPTRQLSAPMPPGLDPLGQENFAAYLQKGRHKAFAVSDRGHYGWSFGRPTIDDARAVAMRFCLTAGAKSCRIYMIDDTVVR